MIDIARDYEDQVYIHIIFNYKPVNKLTKDLIQKLIPEVTNINLYLDDLDYKIGGNTMDIYQSIKTIVILLGYLFYSINIHQREGLSSEIEYNL